MSALGDFIAKIPNPSPEGWIWAHCCKALGLATSRINEMPTGTVIRTGVQWYVTKRGLRRMIAIADSKLAKELRVAMAEDDSEAYKVAYEVHKAAETKIRMEEDMRWENVIIDLVRQESKALADMRKEGSSMSRRDWYEQQSHHVAQQIMAMRAMRGAAIRTAGLPWFVDDTLESIQTLRERAKERIQAWQSPRRIRPEDAVAESMGTATQLLAREEGLPRVVDVSVKAFTEVATRLNTSRPQKMLDDDEF